MESTGHRRPLGTLLPHPAVLGAWLTSLLATPILAAAWALHPSHGRAEWAIGLAALAVLGTVVLGGTFTGDMRLERLAVVLATGMGVLLAEYAVAYVVLVPTDAGGADNAAAIGGVVLAASLIVVLGTLLGMGLGLRAAGEWLIRARRKTPPRPDLVQFEGLR